MEISISLSKLKHVIKEMKNKDGKDIKVMIIPIEENHLYHGDKGSVGINIKAWDQKEKKDDGKKTTTHYLKQIVGKAVYDQMTEEQRQSMPILGNVFEWNNSGGPAIVKSEEVDDNFEMDETLPF